MPENENENPQDIISSDPEEILRAVQEERKGSKADKKNKKSKKKEASDTEKAVGAVRKKRGKASPPPPDSAEQFSAAPPSESSAEAEQILRAVREERAVSGSSPADPEKGERHGIFKTVMILNLLADAAMCLYSAYMSRAPVITVGMTVLALCFLIVVPGLMLLRVSIRRSSAALASLAYTAVTALIGFVFCCEFFGILPEGAAFIEGAAIAGMVVLVMISVNVLVKRMVDKNM